MSSYKGLYVLKLSTGEIHGVQVEDPNGISQALDPDEYRRRNISPPIEELPDSDKYEK